MFCGIGGFRLGLERANKTNREYEPQQEGAIGSRNRPIGDIPSTTSRGQKPKQEQRYRLRSQCQDFECVWSNDNDKYACQIYRKHFGEVHEGDIRAVGTNTIPEHDLLCAGFPCQSFSIAGKRRGFEDTRGTLFFEICRILRAKRPGYVFLENVRGLQSADDGQAFGIVLSSLDELGYDCQWEVLNSKDFGVPQNRERVFIIGHSRGQPRPKVFPLGEASGDDEAELQYVGVIMSEQNQKWLEDGKELSRNFPQGQRVYSVGGIASSIYGDAGGLGGKTGLYEIPIVAETFDSLHGFGHGWQGYHNRKAMNKGMIRRLTPIECERLQGFPDNWTAGISDSQRYKCLGNAVTVNVIEAIGRQLMIGICDD